MKLTFDRIRRYLRELLRILESEEGSSRPGGHVPPVWLVLRLVAPLAAVGAATAAMVPLRGAVPNDFIALVYVLVVIAVADLVPTPGWWIAPITAALVLDYFFTRPYLTLVISSPHDIAMVGLFLLVGLVSSRQVGRLRRRTRQSEERQHDLQLLNTLSTALVLSETSEDMAHSLCSALAVAGIRKVVLFVSRLDDSGAKALFPFGDTPEPEDARAAEWVMRNGKALGIPRSLAVTGLAEPWPVCAQRPPQQIVAHGAFIPLVSSKQVEGVLLADAGDGRGEVLSDESRLIVSAANLATTFLQRRRLQRQANAAALIQESDRLKTNLLSAVSHDIKTPLAAAKAHVTNLLVDDEWAGEEQTEDLRAAADSLDRLTEMIDDLIDLSRLESEGWRQKIEPCEPGQIMSAVLATLGAESTRVHVDLDSAPAEMLVDFRQMERALRNLIANALVYSQGDVRVAVSSDSTEVAITVEDEGPGVADAEKATIFEKFQRGSAARGVPGGTGLGLAIVREVARAHGGTVSVEDASPTGARFRMSLPATVAC